MTICRKVARMAACGCALLLTVCSAASATHAQEAAVTNAAVLSESALRRAADAERRGQADEAIAAYESLLKSDASFETVVAPRLTGLYASRGQAQQALAWAVRVARHHPDPAAYLAGVHAQLGQFKEAELTLRNALDDETNTGKRIALLWQLADAQERHGATKEALATLAQARDAAPEGLERQTATRRLDALRQRLKHTAGERVPMHENSRDKEVTP